MKTKTIFAIFAICMVSVILFAEDSVTNKKSAYDGIAETIPPKQIDWAARSEFGSKGNVTVYVNNDGIPTEVYVIGVAPVSTTLVAVEAEQDAMEEAEFNAKAAFALWMHEKFAVKNVREKEVLVVRTNGKEYSESKSLSKRKAEQMASAAWRGMSVYTHKRMNGRYMAVWRWSVTEHKLAQLVEILTKDGDAERKADMKVKEFDWRFR